MQDASSISLNAVNNLHHITDVLLLRMPIFPAPEISYQGSVYKTLRNSRAQQLIRERNPLKFSQASLMEMCGRSP